MSEGNGQTAELAGSMARKLLDWSRQLTLDDVDEALAHIDAQKSQLDAEAELLKGLRSALVRREEAKELPASEAVPPPKSHPKLGLRPPAPNGHCGPFEADKPHFDGRVFGTRRGLKRQVAEDLLRNGPQRPVLLAETFKVPLTQITAVLDNFLFIFKEERDGTWDLTPEARSNLQRQIVQGA